MQKSSQIVYEDELVDVREYLKLMVVYSNLKSSEPKDASNVAANIWEVLK